MTKTSDDERPRKKSKLREVSGWALMSLLVVGLGGFGVSQFGGRVTSIGAVGDVEISTTDYALAMRAQANTFAQQTGRPVSAQELIALGFGQDVLRNLIARAAFANEVERMGLSVGDTILEQRLRAMDAFHGLSGTFDSTTYRFQLEQLNRSEAEFEADLRRDISIELLQAMVAGGITAPKVVTDRIQQWMDEQRGFSVLQLGEADLTTPLPDPTEADLTAFHAANPDLFIKPEARRITYVALLPENIAADQPVDEAAVRALYDARIDEYVLPERRIVERLVYPDQAAADAARARLDTGTPFEALVAERGLRLQDTELGDVEREDLGEAADPVFTASEGAVVGPLSTNLGPALFRVATVLAAEETPFDAVRNDLALELQTDAARAEIEVQFEVLDDLLVGGATLEDLAQQQGLTLASIDYVPGAPPTTPIENYASFRQAAEIAAEGDFPEMLPLEDGGLFALRLDAIVPAAPMPFADARAAVEAAWRADALTKALVTRAEEIKQAVEAGATLGSFGIVSVTSETDRTGTIPGAPASLMRDIFTLPEGGVMVANVDGFVGVIKLDRILPAQTEGDAVETSRAIFAAELAQSMSSDVLAAFSEAITNQAGLTLDQAAVNLVNQSLN